MTAQTLRVRLAVTQPRPCAGCRHERRHLDLLSQSLRGYCRAADLRPCAEVNRDSNCGRFDPRSRALQQHRRELAPCGDPAMGPVGVALLVAAALGIAFVVAPLLAG